MTRLARRLDDAGYQLWTGDAQGADEAFKKGANNPLVFQPGDASRKARLQAKGIWNDYARRAGVTPWVGLKPFTKRLMARNVLQVTDLQGGVTARCICWTPDGCTSHAERTSDTGGTGMAISVADYYDIPVVNLQLQEHRRRIEAFLAA